MTNYRRAYVPGASWFFTLNLAQRKDNHLLIDNIDVLRTAFRCVKARHPFRMNAVVVLPDHMHLDVTARRTRDGLDRIPVSIPLWKSGLTL